MFNKNLGKQYKNALILGAGGGNDIVSAILVAMYLQKQGIKTDISGILSPGAVHSFNGNLERVVNEIKGVVIRKIFSKKPIEISFIDGQLPELVSEMGIPVARFYDFSIRYGTAAFVNDIRKLIKTNGYDLVVVVDVGGDILARGPEDSTLLSPSMDFTSLYLLGQLDIDSIIVEFGLGTDGELRPAGMKEILKELKDKNLLIHQSEIKKSDLEIIMFRKIVKEVSKTRVGHTAVMTLQTLDTPTPEDDIVSEYRLKSRVGNKKWYTPFTVILPHQYFKKVFIIDGKGMAQNRRLTAFSYSNLLEQYIRLKMIPTWKTELDLFYLWSENNWKSTEPKGHCLQLLVPSTLIPEQTRQEILQKGVSDLKNDLIDLVLVLTNDLKYFPLGSLSKTSAGRFSLLSYRKNIDSFAKQTAKKIKEYQKK